MTLKHDRGTLVPPYSFIYYSNDPEKNSPPKALASSSRAARGRLRLPPKRSPELAAAVVAGRRRLAGHGTCDGDAYNACQGLLVTARSRGRPLLSPKSGGSGVRCRWGSACPEVRRRRHSGVAGVGSVGASQLRRGGVAGDD